MYRHELDGLRATLYGSVRLPSECKCVDDINRWWVQEDIHERLDASVKRILLQNRQMAEELRLHVQETDFFRKEVRVRDVAIFHSPV